MYQFFHRPTPVIIMIFILHLGHFLLEAVSELLAQLFDPALVARRHHTPRLTLMFRMRMLMRMRMREMVVKRNTKRAHQLAKLGTGHGPTLVLVEEVEELLNTPEVL